MSPSYRSTPLEQTYPSIAARKEKAARRKELEASKLRAEALAYRRAWQEFESARLAAKEQASA